MYGLWRNYFRPDRSIKASWDTLYKVYARILLKSHIPILIIKYYDMLDFVDLRVRSFIKKIHGAIRFQYIDKYNIQWDHPTRMIYVR